MSKTRLGPQLGLECWERVGFVSLGEWMDGWDVGRDEERQVVEGQCKGNGRMT